MTASITADTFAKVPAFSGCSKSILNEIHAEGKYVKISMGQALSTSSIISNRVLLILSGKARLLGKHKGQLHSLALLGPGNFVGLASLLRADACEEVGASTSVEAWEIPDKLIARIYEEHFTFREWCNTTIFPAEIASLADFLLSQKMQSKVGLLDILGEMMEHSKVCNGSNEEFEKTDQENVTFIASNNSKFELNSIISDGHAPPEHEGIFNLRLLKVKASLINSIEESKSRESSTELSTNTPNEPTKERNLIPSRTSLELNANDPKNLKLISGEGYLQESMACFRMIADLMDLPFRKDAIEKSIKESLQRGKAPTLPMLGQLLAGMGLHATGARVPASFCTRMNVPVLIAWDDGFGLVVQSNDKGFLLAHPRLGWCQLDPATVESAYPEGLEVIQVSRTSNSPNANFDFGWFLPAIKKYRSTLSIVFISTFVVQLFTLANPLLIQVIIDKVLSQRSLDTLQVLGIALVAITLFEGV